MCLVIGGGRGGGGSARAATTSSLLRLHVFPPWRGLASPIDDAAAVRQQKGPRRLPFRRSSSPIHQQSMYVLKPRPSTKPLPKHRRTSARLVRQKFQPVERSIFQTFWNIDSCTDSLFLRARDFKFLLVTYFFISFNCAKFQQD